jgi:hypothetical protein
MPGVSYTNFNTLCTKSMAAPICRCGVYPLSCPESRVSLKTNRFWGNRVREERGRGWGGL